MGLTIHYNLHSSSRSTRKVLGYVEKMRQLALDLPFEEVSDLIVNDNPNFENVTDESLRWMLIQSTEYVKCPWNDSSYEVKPIKLIAFTIYVGHGSESANIGLCLYPKEIVVDGNTIKTKLSGWRWRSFCKTQYANNPSYGGIPNFLRCHIGVITLLDRIAELSTISVKIDDEGKYGPSYYTDNWKVSNPVYSLHDGKYNTKALVEEIGSWDEMIAAIAGAIGDSLSDDVSLISPIKNYQNFEQLEFKGSKKVELQSFLENMKILVDKRLEQES